LQQEEKKPSILQHVSELISRIKVAGIITFSFFAFFFLFEPRFYYGLVYPYPSLFSNFGSSFFTMLKEHILPQQMLLININPFDSLTADVYSCLVLALICSMPVWVYEIHSYVAPALLPTEKRLIKLFTIPSALLFAGGVFFAYYFVLPFLFRFMLYFALAFHVLPTISVISFIMMIFAYMIGIGLSFEMPMVMVALSYVHMVSWRTWLQYWRYAVVVSFFIALIISPPGATGGIVEISLGLLLSAMFFAGVLVSRMIQGKT
jgi:sec-independent protein translocase protein TatC